MKKIAILCAIALSILTVNAQRVVPVTDTNGALLTPTPQKFVAANGLATSTALNNVSNSLDGKFKNPLTYRTTNTGQLYMVGDSIGLGKYSDAPDGSTYTNAYIRQVSSYLGIPLTNISVSGWCAVDQMRNVFTGYKPSGFDINVWGLGANDARLNTNTLPAYGELSLAQIAWLAFADSDKMLKDNTNVTFSGPGEWLDVVDSSNIGKYTGGLGQWITISNVYGTSFVLGCSKWRPLANTTPSFLTVYVDGVQVSTITNWLSSEYVSNAGYANNYVNTAVVITNLSPTTHTIAMTNGGSGWVTFGWLAAPQMALQKPQVYVMEVTRQTQGAGGYGGWGGSDAGVASFNAALRTNVALLASIGLDVTYVPVSGVVDPRYDLTDGLHPGTRGHSTMANALMNAISGWRRSKGTQTLGY